MADSQEGSPWAADVVLEAYEEGEVWYEVRVRDSSGEWLVRHRLEDFRSLGASLGKGLPPIRRGCSALSAFLHAAVEQGLIWHSEPLRVFLCLPAETPACPLFSTPAREADKKAPVDAPPAMWQHMHPSSGDKIAALRRRSMTLADVVTERKRGFHGPSVVGAFLLAWACWYRFHTSLGTAGSTNVCAAVSLGYLLLVTAGVRVMESRAPVRRRVFEYMLVFNLFQVCLNAWLAARLWQERPAGSASGPSGPSAELRALLWLQYRVRQLDLVDTVFVVLRKKFSRVSFLHIFLRLAHLWGWLLACRSASGDAYFPAAVTSSCHVVVYLYYTASLLGDGLPFFRRARVTEVQFVQFCLCGAHAAHALFWRTQPAHVAGCQLLIMLTSIFLYLDYDTSAYGKRTDPHSGRDTDVSEEQVCFCFDSSGWFFVYHFGVALYLRDHMFPDINTENALGNVVFPKGLKLAGSSGGSLVSSCLACGVNLRALYEDVLFCHPWCSSAPWRLFPYVEECLWKYMPPKTSAPCMTDRVRVLLTRVCPWPPFLTGEVAEQFEDLDECVHSLRASSHVPGLNPCPYRFRRKGRRMWAAYFDGCFWSSLFVPWTRPENSHVVMVSAVSQPLTDIRAPAAPLWWGLLPPSVPVLRGMFYQGYQDAGRWLTAPPSDELTRAKVALARRWLKIPPSTTLPEFDAASGQRVEDLLRLYQDARRAGLRTMKLAGGALLALAFAVLASFS